ncbi:hypothetical protein P3342_007383 [Pyrenophora teres f. teres]|nr:hypothetical protein P3342_007383 [Pyrenophora teres f. teres]
MQNQRDTTIVLRDHTNFTAWSQQLEVRCVAHNVWDIVNPETTILPGEKPTEIRAPAISNFHGANNIEDPTNSAELSPAGLKAFKEELNIFKILFDQYKNDLRKYEKEQSDLQHISAFIQSTISTHLQSTCLIPQQTIREWLVNLRNTVGVDNDVEMTRARERYQAALRPMRSVAHWDTWLSKYDHAATQAEKYKVPELQRLSVVQDDFVKAVNKVEPMWATNFRGGGSRLPKTSRREMLKQFREHMILNHPTRDVKLHAALAAHEDIYDNALAGGESDQELSGTPGSSKTAPSSSKARGRPRKPQQNRRVKPLTPALGRVKPLTPALKRSSESELDLPTTSHSKCEACGQHHNLKDATMSTQTMPQSGGNQTQLSAN